MTVKDLMKAFINDISSGDLDINAEIAIDDGTEKSPIEIKAVSTLMEGKFLFLTYGDE